MKVQLSDFPSESACMSIPHVLYSSPPSKYFTCFTTSIFVETLFSKAKGPGPLSLTTDLSD